MIANAPCTGLTPSVRLYRAAVTNSGVTVESKPARLTVTTGMQGESSNLANLSVRAYAGDGGSQLIAGLSIQATSTPHRMLIRGLGPGLAAFVPGAVKDPALAVRDAGGALMAENDDWSQSPDPAALRALMMNLGAFAIPSGSKDAALTVLLGNGSFTALVRDQAGGTGLVECYDADANLTGGFGPSLRVRTLSPNR